MILPHKCNCIVSQKIISVRWIFFSHYDDIWLKINPWPFWLIFSEISYYPSNTSCNLCSYFVFLSLPHNFGLELFDTFESYLNVCYVMMISFDISMDTNDFLVALVYMKPFLFGSCSEASLIGKWREGMSCWGEYSLVGLLDGWVVVVVGGEN